MTTNEQLQLFEEAYNFEKLYEGSFGPKDWPKLPDNYAARVIKDLLDGTQVQLSTPNTLGLTDDAGNERDYLELADFNDEKLKAILKKISKNSVNVEVSEFNAAYNHPVAKRTSVWSNIKKTEYSNTTGGKNKGNAYEDALAEKFKDYIAAGCKSSMLKQEDYKDVKKVCDAIGYYKFFSSEHAGKLNQSRHPKFTNKGIKFESKNIGSIITDITLNTVDGPLYLSVKYGPKVTFINAGIQSVITYDEMSNGYISNVNGRALLEMIGVDPDKFVKDYATYGGKKKTSPDIVDVTLKLAKSKAFNDFITSVIGYNYVLVHKESNKTGNLNIKIINSEADIKAILGKLISAAVVYPSSGRKRVDVYVNFEHMQLQLNVRPKDGSLYPTHIMSDYKSIE